MTKALEFVLKQMQPNVINLSTNQIIYIEKRYENVYVNHINEMKMHTRHKHANRPPRKKHAHVTCYECGQKGHIAFYCSLKVKNSSFKKIWVPKGSHIVTNSQGPIKVWVPKSST